MIPIKLEDVAEAHLQRLIVSETSEGKTLEFKRDLPGRDSSARHEFLSDVCAFANVSGGDLIFGIDEDGEGVAKSIVGQAVNPDVECLRLQDIVLNGIEPRLTGVHAHAVPVSDGKHVFVVRVPQSWSPPHRVTTNNHFFMREGRRKRQLNVPEIRGEVIRSEGLRDRIRTFRADRIGKIIGGETPVPLFQGTVEVLHVLPVQTLLSNAPVDVLPYTDSRRLPVISGGMGGCGG